MRNALIVTLLASLASLCPGQFATIVNGNMIYTQGNLPPSTSNAWAYADLQANGAGSTDQLWSLWWYYRVAGDTRETTFRLDQAPNTPIRVATAAEILTTWPNVDGRGLFQADLTERLVSTDVDSGYVKATMEITNLTASPLTIDLFSLSDLEVGGSTSGYAFNVAWGDVHSQYCEQQGAPAEAGVEYYCPDADRVQIDTYSPTTPGHLPYLLTNAIVDDLAGWNGTYGPGDHNGAFQWHRTIPAASKLPFTVFVAILSKKPAQSAYGTAGAGAPGLPTISTSERAIIDPTSVVARGYDVLLANALPSSIALLASSLTTAAIVLPDLEIYVDPASALTSVALIDANGHASSPIALPNDPSLFGVSVYHQFFVIDTAASNGLLAWTGGLQQQIGTW